MSRPSLVPGSDTLHLRISSSTPVPLIDPLYYLFSTFLYLYLSGRLLNEIVYFRVY